MSAQRSAHPFRRRVVRRVGGRCVLEGCEHRPLRSIVGADPVIECPVCRQRWWERHAPKMPPRLRDLYADGAMRGVSERFPPPLSDGPTSPRDFVVRVRLNPTPSDAPAGQQGALFDPQEAA